MWYKVKRILVGDKQVRPYRFNPWSNTVLYCPLKDDILDHSWNHTMTAVTSSYGTVAKDSTWYYYFNWWYITSENYTWPKQATVSTRVNSHTKHHSNLGYWWAFSSHYRDSSPYHYFAFIPGTENQATINVTTSNSPSSWVWTDVYWLLWPNVWRLQTMTYSATDWWKFYENWELKFSQNIWYDLAQYNWPTNIWATFAFTDQYYEWYISEVIYEDKVRTAQEILDYYNWTKSNYGL